MLNDIHTIVLNLPYRKDRLESITKEYIKLGFKNSFVLFKSLSAKDITITSLVKEKLKEEISIVNRFTENCLAYNQTMYNMFDFLIDSNIDKVLVLEDDSILDKDINKKLEKVLESVPSDWDIIQLSSYHYDTPEKINDDIYKVKGTWTVTATLYKNTSFKKCRELCNEFRPFDLSLGMIDFVKHGLNIYSPRFNLAVESLSLSDIGENKTETIPLDILTHSKVVPIEIYKELRK
jgi:hypothetical protein